MEYAPLYFYLVLALLAIPFIIYLAVRRYKIKKKETFENRKN